MDANNNFKNRESGLDIVRTVACIFVVAVHFYLNCGYYNEPLVGMRMYVMTFARWLFVSCVPLFFMLTGYLKINKKADYNHYHALIGLFISYVLISVAKMFLYNHLWGKVYGLKDMFKNLGNYQIAWYMGMYLCLFLLIPFLNRMWNALDNREVNILIATLVFLCAVYPVFNYIAPYYFIGLYPVMYYFIGAAIRKWKPKLNKVVLLLITCAVCALEAFISIRFTSTGLFDWTVISTADGTYGTIFIAITSTCIFLLLYDVQIKGKIISGIMSAVSRVSFEIYLFAGAYDAIVFQYLKRSINGATQFFWWFFITVPISFCAAFISALLFRCVVDCVMKLFRRENRKDK